MSEHTQTQLVDREEWREHVGGEGELEEDVVRARKVDESAMALSSILEHSLQPNGTFRGEIAEAMKDSIHWNDVRGGQIANIDPMKWMSDKKAMQAIGVRNQEVSSATDQLEAMKVGIIEQLSRGVDFGVSEGYIPKQSKQQVMQSVKSLPFTVFHASEEPSRLGSYSLLTGGAQVSHDHLDEATETYVHEVGHDFAGGTFQKDKDRTVRTRSGFSQISKKENEEGDTVYHLNLVDEAFREHITLAILNGDWEAINPLDREDEGAYAPSRGIVADFIEKAQGVIKLKTMTQANFEDTGPDGGIALRREMVRQIREAYGPAALRRLEELCDMAETMVDESDSWTEERAMNELSQYIIAPEFDAEGNVVATGRIENVWED